jgi:molybdopterin-containing oxidoreductase family membrane subunit
MLYIIIISGQAYPLDLFPGYTETSSFYDGAIAAYTPSVYEIMLGLGGVGISAAIYIFAIMILDFTPRYLDDEHTLGKNQNEKIDTE